MFAPSTGYSLKDPHMKRIFDQYTLTFVLLKNYDRSTLPQEGDCEGSKFRGALYANMFTSEVRLLYVPFYLLFHIHRIIIILY